MLNLEQCWRAILRRDRRADGRYVFGVATTGVYCRPSCPARRPLRRNVRLFATPAAAERAGLRACLRCRPNAAAARPAAALDLGGLARRVAQNLERPWRERELAAAAGVTAAALRRACLEQLGLTPRALVEAARVGRLKTGLRAQSGIAAATYAAGFGSSSRVYERAATRLGMTPRQYQRSGANVRIATCRFATPLGRMTLAATERGICFAHLGEGGEAALREEFPAAQVARVKSGEEPWRSWRAALQRALAGGEGEAIPRLPVDMRGTVFQLQVWRYLRHLAAGETRTYTEVADAVGHPRSARAVARACAANRIAVLVPCHRVVPRSGHDGGYRWGAMRKRMLLKTESRR